MPDLHTIARLISLMLAGALCLAARGEPTGKPRQKDSVHTMWPWLYYFIVSVLRILFVLVGHWKIKGLKNMPRGGAYLAAVNHVSHIDPPVVGSAMWRPTYFMAKDELFKVPFFGPFIRHIGAYPVKRGAPDRAAIKRTLDLLASGEAVCIFPEGVRGTPGQVGEAQDGFGWVAYKARVPVVPIALVNTADLFPRGAKFLRPSRVRVNIGEPLVFDELWNSSDSRAAMREIGVRTMATIRTLMETIEE